jgi:hypothetical protein
LQRPSKAKPRILEKPTWGQIGMRRLGIFMAVV